MHVGIHAGVDESAGAPVYQRGVYKPEECTHGNVQHKAHRPGHAAIPEELQSAVLPDFAE